ncbi:VOC family protein [Sunxiuqinia sp. A32]|uniref:VOC family protein n=1 Tax=Sunxiuqinia sp. A32 TaxID=3461496 RepID=UPI0040462A8D
MRISHIAIWTADLEGMRNFYMHYFDASSSSGYHNHTRDFHSYFLFFDGDCTIELMQMPTVSKSRNIQEKQYLGLTHFAIKAGSKERVDKLTQQLKEDGFKILGEPRTTGDDFYESVILDPEGNRIEIVA